MYSVTLDFIELSALLGVAEGVRDKCWEALNESETPDNLDYSYSEREKDYCFWCDIVRKLNTTMEKEKTVALTVE